MKKLVLLLALASTIVSCSRQANCAAYGMTRANTNPPSQRF